ncbi:MAG: type II secretion system protein GspD, partial [Methylocella sp.]
GGGGGLGGGGLGGGAGTPESLAGAETAGFGAGFGGGGAGAARALMPGVRILPDVANNAIVIYANPENYRIIEKALNQLDRPVPQVAVDVTVAEVNLNNNLSYGVQFFLGSLNTLNSFSSGIQAGNTLPTPASGFGGIGRTPGFNFLIGSELAPHVIISALNQYTTTKILSNPSLVVIDNELAALQVGDTVPITTGSANILNTATAASNTVFNSIRYQNTGIVLKMRPHVHANGNVNLEIDQQISACKNCQAGSATGNLTPSFTDRHVRSRIMVPDGQTVLLAGLVREQHDNLRAGIPVLEQIPILGEAFASSNNHRIDRTELIIFIRPQVIRDSVDASVVAEELRAKLRGDKIGTLHPPGAVTPYPLGLVQ